MEGLDRAPWFVGDLDDPWVVAIADALPRAHRLHRPGDLPETWPVEGRMPSAVIVHRAILTPTDAQRIVRLRSGWERPPRLVLCVGPHARYVEVERWSRLVDVVIPEATAPETVARHAFESGRGPRHSGPRPRVAIVSTNHELRTTLADACGSGGYLAEPSADWVDIAPGRPIVWDVPVLEPGWADRLARRAKVSPVVVLMGFADRATVAAARENGASACLDLPCDSEDLIATLDRVTAARPSEPAHTVPPPPMGSRALLSRKS
jgi:hypothetical protein